jgi:hypothetical protein
MAAQQIVGLWSERLVESGIDNCDHTFADGQTLTNQNYAKNQSKEAKF